jgi:hypothetical protein
MYDTHSHRSLDHRTLAKCQNSPSPASASNASDWGFIGDHHFKQKVSIPQQFQRLQWCVDLHAMKLDPSKIVFSEESRFVIGDDDRWRYLRRGEWNETAFGTHVKYPASVMIWGAIGANYKSGCVFCSNGVDQAEYQRIIESATLIEDMNARLGENGPYFMQDGASSHTAKKTRSSCNRSV